MTRKQIEGCLKVNAETTKQVLATREDIINNQKSLLYYAEKLNIINKLLADCKVSRKAITGTMSGLRYTYTLPKGGLEFEIADSAGHGQHEINDACVNNDKRTIRACDHTRCPEFEDGER